MSDPDTVSIPCEAWDHILRLVCDHEDYVVYLSVFTDNVYRGQTSIFSRWKGRLKLATLALLGKDYLLYDVVISEANARKLGRFLTKRTSVS